MDPTIPILVRVLIVLGFMAVSTSSWMRMFRVTADHSL